MKKSLCFLLICSVALLNSCKDKNKGDDPTSNATLESIAVTKLPSKMTYGIGETFDLTGMEVTATYSDGDTKPVTITADNLEYDFSATGLKTVIITHESEIAYVNNITVRNFIGSGESAADPYLIGNPLQLANLAVLVNTPATSALWTSKYYRLTADIDLSSYSSGEGWTPIGNFNYAFEGHFDGAGHTVSNLYIDRTGGYTGLFGSAGKTYNVTIENLSVTVASITGGNFTGGIAGSVYGNIADCKVTGGEVSGNDYVGGLVGYLGGDSYDHEDEFDGELINSYSTSEVSGNDRVGGIAGAIVDGIMLNCYATGAVSGNNWVGGITGLLRSEDLANPAKLANCYAAGAVSGNSNVGGIAGYLDDAELINSFATGAVGGNENAGGIAGYVWDSKVDNCAALNPSIEQTGGTALTFGRVAGYDSDESILSNNVGFVSMPVRGAPVLPVEDKDGNNITYPQIISDGTIGGRFISSGGWTTENGRLPGFGATLSILGHLIE